MCKSHSTVYKTYRKNYKEIFDVIKCVKVLFIVTKIAKNLCVLGHTCYLVHRTFMVRSIKDFPLLSMAVWFDGSKFCPLDHKKHPKQV